jgi:tRNA pseudouridine13 synthase
MPFDPLAPPPLVTADLPGVGGRIKVAIEDFEVEEIPAYEPSGNGDFLFLWIEKRDMGAEYFARQIAHRLGIPVGEIGTAGLKDRRAVARQMVSVPAAVEDRLPQLEGDGIRILKVDRHGNKLRPGHLHGNRFRVLIRDAVANAAELVPNLVARLQSVGMPNFYGPQRFGHDGETVLLGLALLRNQPLPAGRFGGRLNARSPFLRKLALSAAQSALFNHYLSCRMGDGLLARVLPGDVMAKWPFGGMFTADDVPAEQLRFEAREIVHTGPIWGRKTFPAAALAAERETAALADCEVSSAALKQFGKLLQGTRRHNIVPIIDLEVQLENGGIRLAFRLPAGSYATVLLRELMKSETIDVSEESSS